MDTKKHDEDDLIASASFRICHKPAPSAITHRLSTTTSPTQTELVILTALGENGRTVFCTFHEENESCVVARPLSDLITVWHADKIGGAAFALHLHVRQRRLTDEELKEAEKKWQSTGGRTDTETSPSQAVGERANQKAGRRKSVTGEAKDANSAIVHLSFPQGEDSQLDPEMWGGLDISLPLTARVESLPSVVATEMRKLVQADNRLFAMLRDDSLKLSFTLRIYFGDYRDCYVNFEQGKVLVQTIASFFADPAEELRLGVVVEVMGGPAETEPAKPADAVERFVVNVSEMFRLGKVKDATPYSKAKDVPHEMAIVGAFDNEGGLRLGSVPIFTVNNLHIGDCYGCTLIKFKESYAWADKYWGARSIEDLAAVVRAHRNDRLKPGMELPTRPDFTFGLFDAKKHGLGVTRWPSSGVHLTVRCVNMLPPDDEVVIAFPSLKHTQYTLEAVDTVESVKMMIREEMRGKGKDGRTCSCLFQDDVVEKWNLVLWVLPQIDGTATLYRWLDGGAMQFLRPGAKGKVDGRLYVEAHVVEVKQDEEDEEEIGSRRDTADPMDGQSEGLFVSF